MVSSSQSSPFSLKHLLVTALVAFAATSTEAAGAKNATAGADNHATFGKITSGNNKCITGDPTSGVTRKDVDWVWENTMSKYVPDFKNFIFDQIIAGKGHLDYCVRWDPKNRKLTKATAAKFRTMLERQINVWNRWVAGYDCWPYDKITVSVVGFAVHDKSILDWDDDSLGTIYEGLLDGEGSPKCPDECYKHQGQVANADTSGCQGKSFDMSLWPSERPGTDDGSPTLDADAVGTGGDWGQRVWVIDMLNKIDEPEMDVILHEMGHGYGLPEMYVAENKPASYPACVMDESEKITDGDGWLVRSIWEHIKSRYNF